MPISVLLVDNNKIFLESVRTLLEIYPSIHVAGETNNATDALAMARDLQPNVIILDWLIPGFSGLDIMQSLLTQYPEMKVIVLSMHSDDAYIESAIDQGASGYVLKDEISSHLIRAIHTVADGYDYFSPSLQIDINDIKPSDNKYAKSY